MMREFGALSFFTAPFKAAAIFGAGLGSNFRDLVNAIPTENKTSNGIFVNALANFNSQARFFEILPQEISKENLGVFLTAALNAKPIKFVADNGYAVDLFALSDMDKAPNNISGELTDPYSGSTIYFNNLQEFMEAYQKLELERKRMLEERAKMDLLLSSPGNPKNIESIYKATAPDQKEDPEAYERHMEEMREAVKDAVKAHASFMTLNELKEFADRYQGLAGLIEKREYKAKELGLSRVEAQSLSGSELDEIEVERNSKYLDIDVDAMAAKIDKLSDKDYASLAKEVEAIENRLVGADPKNRVSLLEYKELREKDKIKARTIIDWFERLEIS